MNAGNYSLYNHSPNYLSIYCICLCNSYLLFLKNSLFNFLFIFSINCYIPLSISSRLINIIVKVATAIKGIKRIVGNIIPPLQPTWCTSNFPHN